MELKYENEYLDMLARKGSNRTFMELKLHPMAWKNLSTSSSNRTFMELKSMCSPLTRKPFTF